MVVRNSLHGASGYVSKMLSKDQAEIEFMLEGRVEHAYLKKDKFFYDARIIPQNEPLTNYIDCGAEVKFSCKVLKKSDKHHFGWIATMCWNRNQTPGIDIEVSIGMVYIMGRVSALRKYHGVLTLSDTTGNERKVLFAASKFYVEGSKLPSAKLLSDELKIGDEVFCDAIPCIVKENEDNCSWLATCAFVGKRPDLLEECTTKGKPLSTTSDSLLRVIESCTSNASTMFISGKGVVFEILNNEFGVILAEFQCNKYQRILFHRKHAYLFGLCLENLKLPNIFLDGDRIKFIAVGAPPDFITDWIAVQVSVCDDGEYGTPQFIA